jgi:hypothetical protein
MRVAGAADRKAVYSLALEGRAERSFRNVCEQKLMKEQRWPLLLFSL